MLGMTAITPRAPVWTADQNAAYPPLVLPARRPASDHAPTEQRRGVTRSAGLPDGGEQGPVTAPAPGRIDPPSPVSQPGDQCGDRLEYGLHGRGHRATQAGRLSRARQ